MIEENLTEALIAAAWERFRAGSERQQFSTFHALLTEGDNWKRRALQAESDLQVVDQQVLLALDKLHNLRELWSRRPR